jgi:Transposase and inactivated derivatives
MERKLSIKARQELVGRHRKERDGRVRDRIKAVLLDDAGYSYSEIGRILLLDDETIRQHIKEYDELEKLKPENGGSDCHLSEAEGLELKEHLRQKTYLYVKDICAHVKASYGKGYSESGMTKWLKRSGFRYKKPHLVPSKADEKLQEAYLKEYEQLKREAGNQEPIYFGDSVHPHHQTQAVSGWILKGERKALGQTGKQKYLSFIGGLSLSGHKLVYEQAEKVETGSIKRFLKKLRSHHREGQKIHLILDNAGYHRSKEVLRYAQALKIKLHYLPPYSPNLNPIERLWKLMREQVTYNKYYEKFEQFTEAILNFFKTISRKKKLLRDRINDNFQKLIMPNFAS